VLVTEEPEVAVPKNAADYATAQWLIRRGSITVLPSVSSLKALRGDAKPSQATIPFIGFGNPLLLGPKENDNRAFAKQTCPERPTTAEPVKIAALGAADPRGNFFRGGLGDVAILRRQAPLPETADELCTIANEVGASKADIHLGGGATETVVKALNADGTLNKAHVVHFATHGLVAGETERVANSLAEPALLLTPPATPTEQDDGLLTASEVAQLKLDADWVVLSACNTAAGSGTGNAEALSGLARAFFYAGARALLVSHWYVDSRAAVLLTTRAFAELEQDPSIGRGEALRRAMLAAMYDAGRPKSWTPAAHPALWAPFVVVGEGGAAERASTFKPVAPASFAAPIGATEASTEAAKGEQKQPKSKKGVTRRRKSSGDWDWLGGF
jgi:CHAT domain-containing protein